MTPTKQSSSVTIDDCDRKHRNMTRLIGVVITLVLGLVAMTGWSVQSSYEVISKASDVEREASKSRTLASEKAEAATREAFKVQQSLNVQRAELNGSLHAITQRLETIQDRQREVLEDLKEQRKIIEALNVSGGS